MVISLGKQIKPHHRQAMKEQKKKAITSLLAIAGPMEPIAITQMLADLSAITIHRYVYELFTAGYIRKVRIKGRPSNVCAYEYLREYGAKTDMVSRAISHPLHQLTLSFVPKVDSS